MSALSSAFQGGQCVGLASTICGSSSDIERTGAALLPAIYQWPELAEEGGLPAYGPRLRLCYRHVVSLVDNVLRGAKPADLPIERPFKS